MLFNTPLFWFFFFAIYAVYILLLRTTNARLWALFAASLLFYGSWNYAFLPLLLFSITVDYFAARGMPGQSPGRKRLLLVASLGVNLGVLAIFKYSNFFFQSMVNPVLAGFDVDSLVPRLDIVLPVGISFYTFQSMSYTIDVYRGHFMPRRDFLRFATSVAFFPQLVAGPIVRAADLLPQMEKVPRITWDRSRTGIVLIANGLFKKTLADLLSRFAEDVFDAGKAQSVIETWTGVLAFAGQIYCDFSGYTDIAIGLGLLMGYEFHRNFNLPYIADSPIDFWRRWHISLSTWLRDYLYIPLGGKLSRYRNVLITMVLGGLWHGASYTFLVWGFYHGLLLVLAHGFNDHLARRMPRIPPVLGRVATFYLVLVGWVFFRAANIDDAWDVLVQMHSAVVPTPEGDLARFDLFLVATALVASHASDWLIHEKRPFVERPWVLWPVAWLFFTIAMLWGGTGQEFIYFQF